MLELLIFWCIGFVFIFAVILTKESIAKKKESIAKKEKFKFHLGNHINNRR